MVGRAQADQITSGRQLEPRKSGAAQLSIDPLDLDAARRDLQDQTPAPAKMNIPDPKLTTDQKSPVDASKLESVEACTERLIALSHDPNIPPYKFAFTIHRLAALSGQEFTSLGDALLHKPELSAAAKSELLYRMFTGEESPYANTNQGITERNNGLFAIAIDRTYDLETRKQAIRTTTEYDNGAVKAPARERLTSLALNNADSPEMVGCVLNILAKSAQVQSGTVVEARVLAERLFRDPRDLILAGEEGAQAYITLYPEKLDLLKSEFAALPDKTKIAIFDATCSNITAREAFGLDSQSARELASHFILSPHLPANLREQMFESLLSSGKGFGACLVADILFNNQHPAEIREAALNSLKWNIDDVKKQLTPEALSAIDNALLSILATAPQESSLQSAALSFFTHCPDARAVPLIMRKISDLPIDTDKKFTGHSINFLAALGACISRCPDEERGKWRSELASDLSTKYNDTNYVRVALAAFDSTCFTSKKSKGTPAPYSAPIAARLNTLSKTLDEAFTPTRAAMDLVKAAKNWAPLQATSADLAKLVHTLEPLRAGHPAEVDCILAKSGDRAAATRIFKLFDDPKQQPVAINMMAQLNTDYSTTMLWRTMEKGTATQQYLVAKALRDPNVTPFDERLRILAEHSAADSPKLAKPFRDYLDLLEQAKELGITEPYRYSRKGLKEIVANRKAGPDLEPGQEKLAVVVVGKKDQNGAILGIKESIDQLISRGYRVMLYEADTDQKLIDAVRLGTTNNNQKIVQADFVFIAAHGSQLGISLGQADPRFGATRNTPQLLHSDDAPRFAILKPHIKENGLILLFSCSTNHQDPLWLGEKNIAQKLKGALDNKVEVLAPPDPINGARLRFDDESNLPIGFEEEQERKLLRADVIPSAKSLDVRSALMADGEARERALLAHLRCENLSLQQRADEQS